MKRLLALLSVGLALSWCTPALAVPAIIANTYGSNHDAGGTSTIAATTGTADCPAGSLVGVFMNWATVGKTVTGIADNATGGTNSYSSLTLYTTDGSSSGAQMWYSISAHDLPNGSTITATFSDTTAMVRAIQVFCASGIAASSPVDTGAGLTYTHGNGTALSIGPTAALAQADNLVVGLASVNYAGGALTYTEGGTGTTFSSLGTIIAINPSEHISTSVVSATTALTYAPTINSSRGWGAQIYVFKGAAAASSCSHTLSLLGVGC